VKVAVFGNTSWPEEWDSCRPVKVPNRDNAMIRGHRSAAQ
jgi:hypothetical protein